MARTFTTLSLEEVAQVLGWTDADVAAEERAQRDAARRSDEALGLTPDAKLLAAIEKDKRSHPQG